MTQRVPEQIIGHLEERFTYEDSKGDCKVLISFPEGEGVKGLFTFDASGDGELADLLQTTPEDGWTKSIYHAHAIHAYVWINEQLAKLPPKKSAIVEEQKIKWLLEYVKKIRTQVQWTATLTPSRRLAMDAFLNVNLDSRRVPLHVADVVKVALVSNLHRSVSPSRFCSSYDVV